MPKQKRHIPPILLSDNMVEMAVPALLGGAVDWMTMVHVVTRLTLNPDRHDKISLRQTTKFGPETRTLTHACTRTDEKRYASGRSKGSDPSKSKVTRKGACLRGETRESCFSILLTSINNKKKIKTLQV